MNHKKVVFAGIELDAYIVDGEMYITPASTARGLNKPPQHAIDFLHRRKLTHLSITVEITTSKGAKRTAKAYPVFVIVQMIEYWADYGYVPAKALRSAILESDLHRTIIKGYGLNVINYESARNQSRLEFVAKYTKLAERGSKLVTRDIEAEYRLMSNVSEVELNNENENVDVNWRNNMDCLGDELSNVNYL